MAKALRYVHIVKIGDYLLLPGRREERGMTIVYSSAKGYAVYRAPSEAAARDYVKRNMGSCV